jgi:hypothetical protein
MVNFHGESPQWPNKNANYYRIIISKSSVNTIFWPFKRLQVVAASGQHPRCEKFQSNTKPVYARQAARLYDKS